MTEPDITARYGDDPPLPITEWYFDTAHRDSTQGTKRVVRPIMEDFQSFLDERGIYAWELTLDDARDWLLKNKDEKGAVRQKQWATYSSDLYKFCNERGVSSFDGNPIKLKLRESPNLVDEELSRDPHIVSVNEMSEYISSFKLPLYVAISTTMVKCLLRAGATINLDLMDVNISHPACDWEVHPNIRHKADYIHIPRDPQEGEEFRGEVRGVSNKTSVTRVTPIDDELRDVLLFYLTTRPDEAGWSGEDPLFAQHTGFGSYGSRIPNSSLKRVVRKHSKKLGHWYGSYDDDNINCHYMRHWGSTMLEEKEDVPKSIVKLLRGDKGDTIDTYLHWTDQKENIYKRNVPKFFGSEQALEDLSGYHLGRFNND